MDKIIIRDLLTRGPIGISEEERAAPQDILVNVVLFTDFRKASVSDSIEDCVNYSTIAKKITKLAENNKRKTVEAFAQDIVDLCLEHELVHKVMVRVEKTSAVRFTKAVGVELEREK
ncbi:MAG: dihydroneopterin aldolase [Anaerolineaceae bacterium]|nr:dihydroneopterin aldolase [Anaerolineaceae bacterium]